MRKIIKDKRIVNDDWQLLTLAENETAETITVPTGAHIVPLAVWLTQKSVLSSRAESLKDDVAFLPLIAIDFPTFADGRGYSIAYQLRARLGYKGELRAIGDVLRDQLFYMARVGFNAFATREDRSIDDALKGLTDFSEAYQTAWDQKTPLFRRVKRPSAQEIA